MTAPLQGCTGEESTYERAQHHLFFPFPPVNPQQMPSPPESSGQLSHGRAAANMWLQRSPGWKSSLCPSLHPAVQSCLRPLVQEPAQRLWEDQRKLSKPRLLPSFSCQWIWQDVPATPEPQELAGSELIVNSWLSRWGGASPGSTPPFLQLPVPPGRRQVIPAEPSSPAPPGLCTGYSHGLPIPPVPAPHPLIEVPSRH